MTTTFRKFLEANQLEVAEKQWENMLHHIAEEELVACKVVDLFIKKIGRTNEIHFSVECNDVPRKKGLQADLSKKLNDRLQKHDFVGLGKVNAKVFNVSEDQ